VCQLGASGNDPNPPAISGSRSRGRVRVFLGRTVAPWSALPAVPSGRYEIQRQEDLSQKSRDASDGSMHRLDAAWVFSPAVEPQGEAKVYGPNHGHTQRERGEPGTSPQAGLHGGRPVATRRRGLFPPKSAHHDGSYEALAALLCVLGLGEAQITSRGGNRTAEGVLSFGIAACRRGRLAELPRRREELSYGLSTERRDKERRKWARATGPLS